LFVAYILIVCGMRPQLGPALPPDKRADWREKLLALRAVILPVGLIAGILGSIVAGAATPSEAAGIGALGSVLCAAIYRKLTWQAVMDSCSITLRLSCMVMWIVFAASIFTALYSAIGAE